MWGRIFYVMPLVSKFRGLTTPSNMTLPNWNKLFLFLFLGWRIISLGTHMGSINAWKTSQIFNQFNFNNSILTKTKISNPSEETYTSWITIKNYTHLHLSRIKNPTPPNKLMPPYQNMVNKQTPTASSICKHPHKLTQIHLQWGSNPDLDPSPCIPSFSDEKHFDVMS